MAIPTIKRVARRFIRRFQSWSTIAALTLGGNRIERKASLKGCKNPVLLLYGYGATRRTFSILEKRLSLAGHTLFSINLGGIFGTFNTNPIEELAAKVDEKVERLYAKYKFRGKLSIIAHSKGGLIGTYYVKRLGGDRRTRMLITLGTPHNGNPWAMLAYFTPIALFQKSVRQMAPMSAFLKRLRKGPFPKRVKLYSIYSKDDRVCPFPCSVLEEASNIKNIEVKGMSHSEFLTKKHVAHLINQALDNEMPASLEEWSQRRVAQTPGSTQATHLRIIEGAKSMAFRK